MKSEIIIVTIEKILKYLEPLLPTANCHMVDFFTNNIYEKHIPSQIRCEIDALDTDETLGTIWKPSNNYPELNKFVESTKKHALPSFSEVCLSLNELERKLIEFGCTNLSGFHLETFMSSKKSHEVEILSKIASAVDEISDNGLFVDIGDGKGYLSSALAMHNNKPVLGIDASEINTVGAAKRVAKLNRVLKRTENKVCGNDLYKQTTKFITESTDLREIIQDNFPGLENNVIGLVGLHTCGNLAPSCLRIFHANADVRSLCNVGCCYHLLTEEYETSETNESVTDKGVSGFPLSGYLRQRQLTLGRNARMVSAQSLDRMLHDKEKPSDILFYRSVLQVLLLKHAPHLIDCQAGRCKKPATFTQYVHKTLVKFRCQTIPTDEEICELYDYYLPQMKNLQVFYLLRAHLAPVIEAVILLDRLLYLQELGYEKSYLVQLFDPVISPRCYGLVAFK